MRHELGENSILTAFLTVISFESPLVGVAVVVVIAGLATTMFLAAYALAMNDRAARVRTLVKEKTADLTEANRRLELEMNQREQTEAQLRDSEARYRTLIETSPDGIIIHNGQRILYANTAVARMLGLPDTPEVIVRSVRDFVHPDSYTSMAERARQMKDHGPGLPPLELKLLRVDGSYVEVEANGNLVVLPDGSTAIQSVIRDITSRKQAEEALAQRARQLDQAQSIAHIGSWEWDVVANILVWSDELYRIFGLEPQQFGATYEAYLERIQDEDREAMEAVVERAATDLRPFAHEYRIVRPDGSVRFVESQGEVIGGDNGTPARMMGTCQDITERVHAEQEMREISHALESAVEGIARLDPDGRYVFVNSAYAAMLGNDPAEMTGTPWQPSVHPDDRETMDAAYREMLAVGRVEAEVRGIRKNGSGFQMRVVMVTRRDERGDLAGHHCFMQDISARKFAEDLVKHMAFHDPLTSLANRRLLHDRFTIALAQAARSGEPVAVVSVDIDGFKEVNDTLGHAAGDQLLRTVSRRLTSAVRDGDTVARIGGDEFLLLLPNADRAGAAAIAARVLKEASERTALPDGAFHSTLSLGVAMFPDDGDDTDTLLNYADAAMYIAKKAGGNRCQFVTEEEPVN